MCESPITESDILLNLKMLKNGKSPGTDGLPPEFYKFFWIDIKHLVTDSLNYAFTKGEMSIEQKRGILTLLPKKDKNRLYLKNWRPISLLNTDYKLLAKILGSRLQKVLPYLIHEDQTGYIQGRYIGTNIRLIEDIISFTELTHTPGIIMAVDFEKAFDSVMWDYIDKALEAFNFGEFFRRWVQIMYTNIETCVVSNGHISEWSYK